MFDRRGSLSRYLCDRRGSLSRHLFERRSSLSRHLFDRLGSHINTCLIVEVVTSTHV